MLKNMIWKRIVVFCLTCSIISSSFAGELALPYDKRWVIIGSRETIGEAREFFDYYKLRYKGAAIFRADNGWYAITIGYVPYPEGKDTLNQLIADGSIPADSFLTPGSKFIKVAEDVRGHTTNNSASDKSTSDDAAAVLALLAIGAVAAAYALDDSGSSANSNTSNSHSAPKAESNTFADAFQNELSKEAGKAAADWLIKSLNEPANNSASRNNKTSGDSQSALTDKAPLNGKYVIGITAKDLESFFYNGQRYNNGTQIETLTPGMPATRAGLIPGDIIYRIDDSKVTNSEFLLNYLNTYPGKEVAISFLRYDKLYTVRLTPEIVYR